MALRPPPIPQLDQNRDPRSPLYARSADAYDEYQQHEYDTNYRTRRPQWERHYARMRTATEIFLAQYVESEKHNKARKDMVMAIVGPGLDPGVRDYDPRLVEAFLAQLRSIVLIDFSVDTNRAACQSLLARGVESQRIQEVQFDITQGMGTLYEDLLREKIGSANSEEEVARVAGELEQMDVVGELKSRYADMLVALNEAGPLSPSAQARAKALFASEHTLRLTSKGRDVPLDVISLNMVLAGTGVTGEALFWERYYAAVAQTDVSGREPADEVMERRRKTLSDFHDVITRYNTEIASEIIQLLLNTNPYPDTRILAMTDITTRHGDETGSLQRLDLAELRQTLKICGVEVSLSNPIENWEWADEPEHSHAVAAFTAKRAAPPNGLPKSPLLEAEQSGMHQPMEPGTGGEKPL